MKRIIFIQIETHFVDLNYTCTKASMKNLCSIKLMMTLKCIPVESNYENQEFFLMFILFYVQFLDVSFKHL